MREEERDGKRVSERERARRGREREDERGSTCCLRRKHEPTNHHYHSQHQRWTETEQDGPTFPLKPSDINHHGAHAGKRLQSAKCHLH